MIQILVLACALLAFPPVDQGAEKPAAKPAAKPVQYLTAWPAPANKEAVQTDVEKLC